MSCTTEGIYPYSNADFLKQDFNNYKNLFSTNMLNKRARSSAWLEHQSYNCPFLFQKKKSASCPKEKLGIFSFRKNSHAKAFLSFLWGNLPLSFLWKEKKGGELVVEGSNPSVPICHFAGEQRGTACASLSSTFDNLIMQ